MRSRENGNGSGGCKSPDEGGGRMLKLENKYFPRCGGRRDFLTARGRIADLLAQHGLDEVFVAGWLFRAWSSEGGVRLLPQLS